MATIFLGWAMSQTLPQKDIQFNKSSDLKEVLETNEYAQFRYFIKVELHNSIEFKEKTKNFHLRPGNKKASNNDFTNNMKSNKPKTL